MHDLWWQLGEKTLMVLGTNQKIALIRKAIGGLSSGVYMTGYPLALPASLALRLALSLFCIQYQLRCIAISLLCRSNIGKEEEVIYKQFLSFPYGYGKS